MAPRILTPILGFVLVALGLNVGRLLLRKFNKASSHDHSMPTVQDKRATLDYFGDGNPPAPAPADDVLPTPAGVVPPVPAGLNVEFGAEWEPAIKPSAKIRTGPDVDACKTKWSEGIEDKYSLLVPMHGHVDYAQYFAHYGKSDKVDRIVVAWSNKGEEAPDWSMFPKVCTIVQETDSLVTRKEHPLPIEYGLNNRFRPYACIRTLGVFSVDNDMLIPTEYMDFTFETWRLFKRHIVGFAIRTAKKSVEPKWEGLHEVHWPGWAAGNVPGHSLEYNLVFTNAAIFHRELLNDYTCAMPKEAAQMITDLRSCEDIAMNVLSYAKWQAHPIGITTTKGCVDNYGVGPKFKRDEGGLAKSGDMDTYALFRGKCYRRLCEWLGTDIPMSTVTSQAYNDRALCPPGHKKPGQF